ncbi:hypothetical protein [Streptomyces sp. NPDC087538]
MDVPRRGTAAARRETADGTAAFRAWRDARNHRLLSELLGTDG